MEISATLGAKDLTRALAIVGRTVSRDSTIPILGMMRVEATDGEIVLTANNLDMEMRLRAPADTSGRGGVCIPAKDLQDIASRLDASAAVTLSWAQDEPRMRVLARRGRYALSALMARDFPDYEAGAPAASFSLQTDRLGEMIAAVTYAMSTDEKRYYLGGAYLHAAARDGADVLRLVAADGHCLSLIEEPAPDGCVGMPGVIIPARAVGEIARLCRAMDGAARIAVSDGHVVVEAGAARLTAKVIDGTYPAYMQVIPTRNSRRAHFDPGAMVGAAERIGAVLAGKRADIKMSFEADRLVVSTTNENGEESKEEVPVDYDADPLEIGLNKNYVTATLGALGGERVTMSMSSPAEPVLFERGYASPDRLAVIMPMRV